MIGLSYLRIYEDLKMRKMKKKYLIIISMLVIGVILGVLIPTPTHMMSVDQRRDTFISLKNSAHYKPVKLKKYYPKQIIIYI